eukprot:11816149-Alexandrium_andersonii.AAC.1
MKRDSGLHGVPDALAHDGLGPHCAHPGDAPGALQDQRGALGTATTRPCSPRSSRRSPSTPTARSRSPRVAKTSARALLPKRQSSAGRGLSAMASAIEPAERPAGASGASAS